MAVSGGLIQNSLAGVAATTAVIVPPVGVGTSARSSTHPFGTIASSSAFDVGNTGLTDWFADPYSFSVAVGTASFSPSGDGGFLTEKQVTPDRGPWAPGDAVLSVQGHVNQSPGFGAPTTADDSGNIAFALATPIPEPGPWIMLGLGLAGVALVARRRLKGSRDAG
ncbi:MAG TPA: PEP-CTERM sorting domain-containing protein [Rhizobacter sp.]|nr:PEP-CTERM sorting domain-containing protein [Rhizobacter sp.]